MGPRREDEWYTVTPILANVSASASSVTLFAANGARVGAQLVNDSAATLYLKEGSGASLTSFTDIVPPGATWRLDTENGIYQGLIAGIWSSATGAARCTERVAT